MSTNSWNSTDFEPFVDADAVAEFLSIDRREVLKLTRNGVITGYAISGKLRKTRKYRLSVIAEEMTASKGPAPRVNHTDIASVPMKGIERYA
jgi:hypothetical protein